MKNLSEDSLPCVKDTIWNFGIQSMIAALWTVMLDDKI
jgi:hypothetical protein